MVLPTRCQSCKARGITPVIVVERHGHRGEKTLTRCFCPVCGEVLSESWARRKKGEDPGPLRK